MIRFAAFLSVLATPALTAQPLAEAPGVDWGPCIDGSFEIRAIGEAPLVGSLEAAVAQARLAATRRFMSEACASAISRDQETFVGETGAHAVSTVKSRTLRRVDCNVRLLREVGREVSAETVRLTLALSVPACGPVAHPGEDP